MIISTQALPRFSNLRFMFIILSLDYPGEELGPITLTKNSMKTPRSALGDMRLLASSRNVASPESELLFL